ncbi:MAG: hypothetical protein KJT03_15285 [Verrucomicrobiae bacterium]|nr:hypothetical protein [Verrucomicrobiae bacterium]
MTMTAIKAYDEIINFIAEGTTPEKVIAFRPSAEAQKRAEELLYKEKNQSLTPEEKSELDYFMVIEHLMRMAKARAFQLLAAS